MPDEFWREVVDRVAAEVPGHAPAGRGVLAAGGLLRPDPRHAPRLQQRLHAHAPRRGRTPSYRAVIKNTLEFDPEILKRYVNFMNNPDEQTAVEQFGKGDKYFGVATLLATLPGLPMFGHGQVEGFGEKYGMEFRRATLDEQPDRVAGRAPRARDLPAAAPARAGSPRRTTSCSTTSSRTAATSTRTSSPTRTARGPSARSSSTTTATARPAAGSATPSPYARRSPGGPKRIGPAIARRRPGSAERPGRVRRLPRRADRARIAALVARALGARPVRVTRSLRRATSSGSSARSTTGPPASGRAWPRGSASGPCRRSRTRCASSSSNRSTCRCGRSSTRDWSGAVLDGVAKPARSSTTSSAGSPRSWPRSPTRPGCPATRRPWPRPSGAVSRPPGRHGHPRVARGTGGAARLAGAVTDRGAGTGRGRRRDQPRLVRRAAAAGRPGRGPPPGRPRRGRGLGRGRPGPRAADAAATVGSARARPDRGRPTPRALVGRATWSGPRSASTPGKGVEWLDRDRFAALLAWARRLDAIEASRGRRKSPEGPDATARLMAAAEAAGYRLDELTASLAGSRGAARTPAGSRTAKRAPASTTRIKRAPKSTPASKRRRP